MPTAISRTRWIWRRRWSMPGCRRNIRARQRLSALCRSIHGLPRHLGQHSGGMIICHGQLDAIVPLENATMPGRVVAQWDKDDCEDLGIIKVDFLGLGMMAVLQDAVELTRKARAAGGSGRNCRRTTRRRLS